MGLNLEVFLSSVLQRLKNPAVKKAIINALNIPSPPIQIVHIEANLASPIPSKFTLIMYSPALLIRNIIVKHINDEISK